MMRLRLAFKTDGNYYNLGVVDNKQTGKLTPDGVTDVIFGFTESFEKILAVLLLIVFLVIFWPFLSPIISLVFKMILNGLVLLIKLVFKILFLPERIIWRLLFPKKE